jgi:formamidopyrimidine-DNA glycosylase
MPELPEAETLRRPILSRFLGAVLDRTRYGPHREILIRKESETRGFRLEDIGRIGKVLVFVWAGQSGRSVRLISRLGMSGTWMVLSPGVPEPDHVHLAFSFREMDERLVYRDPRRFGRLEWRESGEPSVILRGQGPDIFEISSTDWHLGVTRSKRAIRSILLDQSLACGIGNIYASEILFRAGISPFRKGTGIRREESQRILMEARYVLDEAIRAGGSTIHSFRDSNGDEGGYQDRHSVYGRDNQPCPKCGVPIRKVTRLNRTLFYCPGCQTGRTSGRRPSPPESSGPSRRMDTERTVPNPSPGFSARFSESDPVSS